MDSSHKSMKDERRESLLTWSKTQRNKRKALGENIINCDDWRTKKRLTSIPSLLWLVWLLCRLHIVFTVKFIFLSFLFPYNIYNTFFLARLTFCFLFCFFLLFHLNRAPIFENMLWRKIRIMTCCFYCSTVFCYFV